MAFVSLAGYLEVMNMQVENVENVPQSVWHLELHHSHSTETIIPH